MLLALPDRPPWADGVDQTGRTVVLVGRHQLGDSAAALEAVATVLRALAAGQVPEGVLAIGYAPAASRAIAEIAYGTSEQVLCDGPRGSGKTQLIPAALALIAERQARAGHPLPLKVIWLHDSLVSASIKTARSLEQPLWGTLWQIREDRRVAALQVGGAELVLADFVGAMDATGQERARAECHVLAAEELVSSLEESAGIPERVFDTARSSMRLLPAIRRVAVGVTNPGAPDGWVYTRWLAGGGQGCVRCAVPATDRLTAEEQQALRATFAASPDLEQRLALGQWVGLKLGEVVGEGYDATVHVASTRLRPQQQGVLLAIGWDGGHSPSAVIGQLIGTQLQVYASLNDMKVGVLELLEDQVIPWLVQWAPWAREVGGGLVHVIDPSMATPGQATIRESAERTIREVLRGRIVAGPVAWSPRREAVLRLVAPRHEGGRVPLLISRAPETRLLQEALSSRWFYPTSPDGRVDRSRPKKPNSPWADIGDAFAYLAGFLRPLRPGDVGQAEVRERRASRPQQYAKTSLSSAKDWLG